MSVTAVPIRPLARGSVLRLWIGLLLLVLAAGALAWYGTRGQQIVTTPSGLRYRVIEAADGIEGLGQLVANPQIRLVLCDVVMPRMNGLDMIDHLNLPANPNLAVLTLTAEGQAELIARAKRAGVKGWIVKPFNRTMLLAAVQRLLGDLPKAAKASS